MDNLVFYSKLIEGDHICIGTVSRHNKVYESEITDFKFIQQPALFLIDEECREFLLTNIKKVTYYYNKSADVIVIKLHVYGNKYISCTLCSKIPDETDLVKTLEQRVNFLESVIDRIEPYELIHDDCYPDWQTLADFEALDCYKYFEAYDNRNKFYIEYKNPSDNSRIGGYYHGELNKTKYLLDVNNAMMDLNYLITYTFHPSEVLKYDSTNPLLYRKSSIKFPIFDCKLNYFLAQFIYDYYLGWCLLNHRLVAFKQPYMQISINNDKVTFAIYRLKKYKIPVASSGQVIRSEIGPMRVFINDLELYTTNYHFTRQLTTLPVIEPGQRYNRLNTDYYQGDACGCKHKRYDEKI